MSHGVFMQSFSKPCVKCGVPVPRLHFKNNGGKCNKCKRGKRRKD